MAIRLPAICLALAGSRPPTERAAALLAWKLRAGSGANRAARMSHQDSSAGELSVGADASGTIPGNSHMTIAGQSVCQLERRAATSRDKLVNC